MYKGSFHSKNNKTAAIIFLIAAAFVLCFSESCGRKKAAASFDLNKVPRQIIDSIFAVQSVNGNQTTRMEAKKMEKYENDTVTYEFFPAGFDIYSYKDSLLETQIHSKQAKHTISKRHEETWAVFGDVVITNFIKGEKMLTDTLYWDRNKHMIHTHCLVKMSSPRGFMQGYGMQSDETARNAEIKLPFDSFSYVGKDSTLRSYVDSANFIGPIMHKVKRSENLIVKGKK